MVAILGVLAAVVIPNVTRFVGAGEQEAAETELHNVQLAVTSMMLENGITTIPVPLNEDGGIAQNDMTLFPDSTSSPTVPAVPLLPGKVTDPEGFDYDATDGAGYILFGHDITGTGPPPNTNQIDINYVTVDTTTYFYTCETDGTVKQWADADMNAIVWD
ncbi:unnamed protein product [marine sediment metagenome]|uniref:Uncharacterized protein n=1 Tax=marine sediment metagenome TaxID=412755 RepID=X1FXE5_9ZZZZ